MANYSIGLSGLTAAQSAIDVIGNNIANAATPGYHKQEVRLSPAYSTQIGNLFVGGGVNVSDVTRMVDSLLEQEMLRQNSSLASLSQELNTLTTVESALGELSGQGTLSMAIDNFFNSLTDLSLHPSDGVWQNHVLSAAENLADQFRRFSDFTSNLQTQIRYEAEVVVDQVNQLTSQIADLNDRISRVEIADGDANNLMDRRDQSLSELSGLVHIQVIQRDYGVSDVMISGLAAVTGSHAANFSMGYDNQGQLALGIEGGSIYKADPAGGKLGGLMSLSNDLINDIQQKFDSIAVTFMDRINSIHAQSVGSAGSFTTLTSANPVSEDMSEIESISDGSFFIRLTDTATGEVTRHEINVIKASDTLADIAARINGIGGMVASVDAGEITLNAMSGYEFDFIPALLPEPDTSNMSVDVAVSGIYTGSENKDYTFTVLSDGDVSATDGLTIGVSVDGQQVKTINVGTGYANGDPIEIEDGIVISLGAGALTAGQTFTVKAVSDSDSSGFLNALGINTMFSGTGAADIAVCLDIADWPGRIAVSQGADMADNVGLLKMIEIKDIHLDDLEGMTIGQYHRRLITDIGQKISLRQMRHDNGLAISKNLAEQQAKVSGVDINEQAAQMMMFEQMFQAMAKYINTIQTSMSSLMEIV